MKPIKWKPYKFELLKSDPKNNVLILKNIVQ